jgi:hypothetical protein
MDNPLRIASGIITNGITANTATFSSGVTFAGGTTLINSGSGIDYLNASGEYSTVIKEQLGKLGSPLEFDINTAQYNSSFKIDDTHVMNFWNGLDSDGFCQIFEITASTGQIEGMSFSGGSGSFPLEFDTVSGQDNSALKIDDTHVMNFWLGTGTEGLCQIFGITASTGQIEALDNSLSYEALGAVSNSSFKIDDTHMMNFWGGDGNASCQIFAITASTGQVDKLNTPFIFNLNDVNNNNALLIDSTRVMNFWEGDSLGGSCQIFAITASTGQIEALDTKLIFDGGQGTYNSSLLIDSGHVMNFWQTGSLGYCQIFEITASTGQINGMSFSGGTGSFPLEFDTNHNGHNSALVINSTHVINFWSGLGNDGYCQIFNIDVLTGIITPIGVPLEFDILNGQYNSPILINPIQAINFWSGDGGDGYAQIFNINPDVTSTTQVTSKDYQDTHIGGQSVSTGVTSPTVTEDGQVITWNDTNQKYELSIPVSGDFLPLTGGTLTGALSGTTFNNVALTTGGTATNYLDETGNYSSFTLVDGSGTTASGNSINLGGNWDNGVITFLNTSTSLHPTGTFDTYITSAARGGIIHSVFSEQDNRNWLVKNELGASANEGAGRMFFNHSNDGNTTITLETRTGGGNTALSSTDARTLFGEDGLALRLDPFDTQFGQYVNGTLSKGLSLGTSTPMVFTDSVNSKGLVYAADYSTGGTADDRWIPDYKAVKDHVTTSFSGVTLISGGSSSNYLSEDGTYTTPAGGGGGGDYLPLSGGTLTGAVSGTTFNGVALVTGGTGTNYLSEDGTYTQPAGSGTTVTVGSDNEIPFTNGAGTDFEYVSGFTYNGNDLTIEGNISVEHVDNYQDIFITGASFTVTNAHNGAIFHVSGTTTVTLPSTVPQSGWHISILRIGTATVTIAPNGNTIKSIGSTSPLIEIQYGFGNFHSDGTDYFGGGDLT